MPEQCCLQRGWRAGTCALAEQLHQRVGDHVAGIHRGDGGRVRHHGRNRVQCGHLLAMEPHVVRPRRHHKEEAADIEA